MNWTTKTSGTLYVNFNFANGFFSKTPAIVFAKDTAATAWSTHICISMNGASYSKTYILTDFLVNSSKSVQIDLTDRLAALKDAGDNYVRLFAFTYSGSAVQRYVELGNIYYYNIGEVPPEVLLPPPTALATNFGSIIIPPPSRIIRRLSISGLATMVVYSSVSGVKVGTTAITAYTPTGITVSNSATTTYGTASHKSQVINYECGKQYGEVKWRTPFGGYCEHGFELRDVKFSISGTKSLQSVCNELRVISGYEVSGTMHFDNLNAYDYWYYSLIALSQEVYVSISGYMPTYYPFTNRAQITTKKVSQPNGNGRYTLDIDFTMAQFSTY